ncbi:MAG TPA: SDR family oxidoreductase [Bacteroidia bacterium]|nr:SDR family oxidoreductase [Bacteroidia bacterium]
MVGFQDKVILITGSSLGIGKDLARLAGQQKARIAINARNKERLYAVRDELNSAGFDVIALAGDVSREEDCRSIIDSVISYFGRIDILINNAALSMRGRLEDLHLSVISTMYGVNVLGPVVLTRLALPHIIRSKGSIVFISSLAGMRGLPLVSVYSSAKMALTAIAESLRIEHSKDGVHVGIVYVGYTEVKAGKVVLNNEGQSQTLEARTSVFVNSTEDVANQIIRHIQKRRSKTIIGGIGKTYSLLNRLFPRLMDIVTAYSYQKFKKAYK